MNEAFIKLCGINILKESSGIQSIENKYKSISPEEVDYIVTKTKDFFSSVKNYDFSANNIEIIELDYIKSEGLFELAYALPDFKEGNVNYHVSVYFGGKITHMESPDSGDRYTAPSGGGIEFECIPVKVRLVSEDEIEFKEGFVTDDRNLLDIFFNYEMIWDNNINEFIEKTLMDEGSYDGPDGYSDDSQSAAGRTNVDGQNFAGSDWDSGRDNPFV